MSMKTITIFLVVCVLAVSVAISGCAGQSPAGNETAGGSQYGSGANWCPAGRTTSYTVQGLGVNTMTYLGLQSYSFPDGSVTVCCMDGEVQGPQERLSVKVCIDKDSKHMVQWQSKAGEPLKKTIEFYVQNNQSCIKGYDQQTGEAAMETCQ